MMLPIFYVDPYTGNIFVLVAFTIVMLGEWVVFLAFSWLIIGITESVGGFCLAKVWGR